MNAAPPEHEHEPRADAALFAWLAWAGLLAVSAGFVARYGSSVPVWDDFDVLGRTLGDEPVTIEWLWSQHNEHRVPLPRLILIGLDRVFGPDARAGMGFSVAVLAVAAAALMRAVARRRGGSSYADALFPLVLLGPGHHANLLWSWQLPFTVGTALFLGIVSRIVTLRDERLGLARAATIGTLLALLPLCAANGVALVPALAFWLATEAVRRFRGGQRREALALALAVLPGAALAWLYFRGYQATAQHPAARSLDEPLRVLLQFLALGLGPGASAFWEPAGFVMLGAFTVAVVFLATRLVASPGERSALGGLLASLLAFGALAAGLAWGRAGSGERAGLEPRYVTLASPAMCLLYLTAQRFPRRGVRTFVAMVLFTTTCVLAWPNAEIGITAGSDRAQRFAGLEADIHAGAPPSLILRRHVPFLHPSPDALAEWLPVFRRNRVGPFAALRAEPELRKVALPITPVRLHQARQDGDTFTLTGIDPQITFALPRTTRVVGVRLAYDLETPDAAPAHFRASWRTLAQPSFAADRSFSRWALPAGRDLSTTFWLHDPVDELQIQPDTRPGTFRIRSLTLLVAPGEAPSPASHHSRPATTRE
jgi:hypothetical protein